MKLTETRIIALSSFLHTDLSVYEAGCSQSRIRVVEGGLKITGVDTDYGCTRFREITVTGHQYSSTSLFSSTTPNQMCSSRTHELEYDDVDPVRVRMARVALGGTDSRAFIEGHRSQINGLRTALGLSPLN